MEDAAVERIRNTDARVKAPPAKAHTLRALIIASLAEGGSVLRGPLLGEDQLNVIECLRRLGIDVERDRGDLKILGRGGRYAPTGEELDVGESGVGMNFLSSAACLADMPVVLTGAERITRRPIAEVVSGLSLTFLGSLRELFGEGTLFGQAVMGAGFEPFTFMVQAPGAFVCLGILLGLMNIVEAIRTR